MGNTADADARKFETQELRAKVVKLRVENRYSYRQIGEKVDRSTQRIKQIIDEAFEQIVRDDVERLRDIENELIGKRLRRLEKLLDLTHKDAVNGSDQDAENAKPYDAARAYAALQAQWTALARRYDRINGLEAPEKHEHTGKDGGPIAYTTPVIMIPPERSDSATEPTTTPAGLEAELRPAD